MDGKQFFGTLLAVAIGTLIALAIAGMYVQAQVSAATAGSSTLGTILSFFGPKAVSATPATS
jgi:hypothetical protein